VRWRLVVIAWLVAWLGCYAPSAQPGAACANGQCPEGLVCSPMTNTCERMAIGVQDADIDARTVDAPPADAPPDAAPATATLIQQATNSASPAATLTATLPAAPVAGHMLVMIGATPSGALTTVSGGGATWTRAASSTVNSNIELWYGVTDGSSATVTINRTNNLSTMWLAVSEWAGLATTTPLDRAIANDGIANPVTAGAITTTNARDLVLFAASAYAPNTYGVPGPGAWTAMTGITTSLVTQGAWYRIESTTATLAPQVTRSGGSWDAVLVALRITP
jgi:hypothetical protein